MTSHVPVHSWRASELGGLDLLHGSFTTHVFSRHTHETYSIGLLRQGAMTFQCRGSTHTLFPGLIGLIQPDEAHNGHADDAAGWTYRNFYPTAEVMHAAFEGQRTGHISRLAPVIDDPALFQELMTAHQTFEVGTSSLARESLMRSALTRLVLRHAAHPPPLPKVGQEHQALARVQAKLEDDLHENVTLSELAQLAGLNGFTLLRAFRQHYGLPPHAYQVQVRLRRAKQLLQLGESPLQVALTLGFADQSHFGRHFRRAYGISPEQYRRGVIPIAVKSLKLSDETRTT